jgi:hypothetical protein
MGSDVTKATVTKEASIRKWATDRFNKTTKPEFCQKA